MRLVLIGSCFLFAADLLSPMLAGDCKTPHIRTLVKRKSKKKGGTSSTVKHTAHVSPQGVTAGRHERPADEERVIPSTVGLTIEISITGFCDQPYWSQYRSLYDLTGRSPISRSAGLAPITALQAGQAAQAYALADLNSDGVLDGIFTTSSGVTVNLRKADDSLLSTKSIAVGFQPDLFNSQLVVADFNGDGKLDLAVTNYGKFDGSNPGYVAVLMGNGDGTFGTPATFAAGVNPSPLAAADFTGDGKLDIAAGAQASGQIALLAGNGNGTFGSPTFYATGATYPQSVLAVDLNADGRPDLAIANLEPSISVLLNAQGSLGQPRTVTLPSSAFRPAHLAFGDWNHDGKLDLAAGLPVVSAVALLQGKGDGNFEPPAFYTNGAFPDSIAVLPTSDGLHLLITGDSLTGDSVMTIVPSHGVPDAPPLNFIGGFPTGVAAADLNGDGQPDVVVTGGSNDVTVAIAQGGYRFMSPVGYSLAFAGPQAVAIGDLNNDSRPDVVTANSAGTGNQGSASVLLGNGDGTLKPASHTPVPRNARSLVLGDFNRDGKLDAAVAAHGLNAVPGGLLVLMGKGDGTFQAPLNLPTGGLRPQAVATADLNSDDKLDLAAVMNSDTAGQQPSLAIFLGQGDGNFAAPRTFSLQAPAGFSGSGSSGLAIGDLNGDRKPDLAVVSNLGLQNKIDILLGDGAGGFAAASSLPATDFGPTTVAMADLDGDGRLDLVVPHCCGLTEMGYFLGKGDGTFQSEDFLPSGASPRAVAVTKFGGSHGPDLAVANFDGVWTPLINNFPIPTPTPVSTAPASGSGTGATFTFTFSDPGGYQNLSVVNVLINTALDGRQSCYLAFAPAAAGGGSLYLVNDAGDAGGPYQGLVLPGAGTIANSQCGVNGASSSVNASGNNLTLTLAITFTPGFAGNKVVYLSAQSKTPANSGWQALGTWGIPGAPTVGPSASGVNPARITTAAQTVTFTFTDTNGWQDIGVANILINSAIDGRKACYLAFVPSTGSLFLVNDAGDSGGPYQGMVLPGTGSVGNSQCSIGGAGSTFAGNGNNLILTLAMTFNHAFAGNQVIYLAARNNTLNSGWLALGSVSVP